MIHKSYDPKESMVLSTSETYPTTEVPSRELVFYRDCVEDLESGFVAGLSIGLIAGFLACLLYFVVKGLRK